MQKLTLGSEQISHMGREHAQLTAIATWNRIILSTLKPTAGLGIRLAVTITQQYAYMTGYHM